MKISSGIVLFLAAATLSATQVSAQETVAITEFMSVPYATSQAFAEWVELYNFGTTTVTLNGWSLTDDDTDKVTIPDSSIPPGNFLIVASNKRYFEAEWLAGIASEQVVQMAPPTSNDKFQLSTDDDEIVLKNQSGQAVWRLRYIADDLEGYSTFLTGDAGFNIRNYGTKTSPVVSPISRSAADPANPASLGYQGSQHTADPFGYSGGNRTVGGVGRHNYGSPLRGDYPGAQNPIPASPVVIDAAAEGAPISPGVRGMALHDMGLDDSRAVNTVPPAREVAQGGSIRGVAGGLAADVYDWRTRNTLPRPTTLQFLRYQRDDNARMYVTVNTRGLVEPDPDAPGRFRYYNTNITALADMAAEWVRYTNHIAQTYREGDTVTNTRDAAILDSLVWNSSYPGDTWTKLLPDSETSVPKVMYWEIGNEPTISVTGAGVTNSYTLTPADYHVRYKAITQAMLAEDPTIKVGPCVVHAIHSGAGRTHLALILADPECQVNFISYHPYGNMEDEPIAVQANLQANLQGAYLKQWEFAEAVHTVIAENRPGADIELVASETNIGDATSGETELEGTMAFAIGSVESIFSWGRLGLDAAHYWIWPSAQGDGFKFPVFNAFEMLRDHMGDRLLNTYIDLDNVRAYTTRNTATGEVAVWGLNFSSTDKDVRFNISNMPGRRARLYTLGNPSGPTTLRSKNLPSNIAPGPANEVSWTSSVPAQANPSDMVVNFKAATLNMVLFEPVTAVDEWMLY